MFLFIRKTDANIILLQETHSSDTDTTFRKSQWGGQAYFSHASHRSAGVSFLFNRFTGDILEHFNSEDGRWIIVVVKLDNSLFLICNVVTIRPFLTRENSYYAYYFRSRADSILI